MGMRTAAHGNALMAIGLSRRTPNIVASRPPAVSRACPMCSSSLLRMSPLVQTRHDRPNTSARTAMATGPCHRPGADGRPDSACTIGTRAIERAGHHAAAVAVTTPSTTPVAMSHHGTSNRGIRYPRAGSRNGTIRTQPAIPHTVPTIDAVRPTMKPFVSTRNRTWPSLPPIAPSMPSCRSRRCAMTTNPAAATSATSASTTVPAMITSAAANTSSSSARDDDMYDPRGGWNESNRSADPPIRIVIESGASVSGGAMSAKSAFKSLGFSTTPTTVRSAPSTSNALPMLTANNEASPSVTAISSALAG